VPTADDPTRAPRSGLWLMLIIVAGLALVAIYANVQKARHDKIEQVTIILASPVPTASASPKD
jgi:hypothetical protein